MGDCKKKRKEDYFVGKKKKLGSLRKNRPREGHHKMTRGGLFKGKSENTLREK